MPEAREARLFVLTGPDLARSFALGERTTLGRSSECDVVLRDRSISRKHAVLVRQGEAWIVEDLGSTNGLSRDGQRAERLELADGDEFALGDLRLRFKLGTAPEAQEIEFAFDSPAPVAPAAPAPRAAAEVEIEAEAEIEIEIEIEEDVEAEVEIEGAATSRRAGASPLAATAFRPERASRRTGVFSADLEQQPFWLRVLLVLGLLVLGGGLAYGAFWVVQLLRSGV